jgi:diguanylate cyclase (GGDEF)-like protein/PAS domain S-box-containing protein
VLVAAGVVAAIATVGEVSTIRARTTAEARLDAETLRLLPSVAATLQSFNDPDATQRLYGSLPWALDGGPVDQAIVQGLTAAPLLGPGAVVGLARLDGTPLAMAPAGARPAVGPQSPAWTLAVAGRTGIVPDVHDPDMPRVYFVIPLIRDGRPRAIELVGTSLRTGVVQRLTEQMSSLGNGSGMSVIDARGVVLLSWDPALLGRRIAEPARLTGLAPGESRLVSEDPELVVVVTPYESMSRPEPVYSVFSQPTRDYYRDLRTGLLARDLGLLVVVMAAVAGLAWVNLRRERAARSREEWLDALLHQTHDIVAVADGEGRLTFVSSAAGGLLGGDPAGWLDRPVTEQVHPADRARVRQLLAAVARPSDRSGRVRSASDVRLARADGSHRWFDIDAVSLAGAASEPATVLTCHDVSARRALQDRLSFQATHDPLTALPNRAVFATHLEALGGPAAASTPGPFAVLYIDLDRFKPVNDELGHDIGDVVLCEVAARVRRSLRTGTDEPDATGTDLVCRLGGDEFAVLLPGAGEEGARAAADRILAAVRRPIAIADREVCIDATIGIALAGPDTDNPSTIVRDADNAMYQAKSAGRSGYRVFSTS